MFFGDSLTVIQVGIPACPIMEEPGKAPVHMGMPDIESKRDLADQTEIIRSAEQVVLPSPGISKEKPYSILLRCMEKVL
jgi:hypothetical protein